MWPKSSLPQIRYLARTRITLSTSRCMHSQWKCPNLSWLAFMWFLRRKVREALRSASSQKPFGHGRKSSTFWITFIVLLRFCKRRLAFQQSRISWIIFLLCNIVFLNLWGKFNFMIEFQVVLQTIIFFTG